MLLLMLCCDNVFGAVVDFVHFGVTYVAAVDGATADVAGVAAVIIDVVVDDDDAVAFVATVIGDGVVFVVLFLL